MGLKLVTGLAAFSLSQGFKIQLLNQRRCGISPISRWKQSQLEYSTVCPFNRRAEQRNSPFLMSSSSLEDSDQSLDVGAVARYVGAIGIEIGAFTVVTRLLDLGMDSFPLPLPLIGLLAYAASLKSRVFNPLDNSRPNLAKAMDGKPTSGFQDRKMPSFTPPGIVFPIMWILIIGPLRAYSTTLVFQVTGQLCHPAILALLFHLSVGDTWNTINNVEKRFGASVVGVLCVVASAANAAFQYYQVDPLAGKLLGATCIWLTIAATLITTTWLINPVSGDKLDKLYPVKSNSVKTKFIFEE